MNDDPSRPAQEVDDRIDAAPIPKGSAAERGQVDLGPLPDMVGYALRRAQVAVFRQFARAFAELEIRPGQLGVLTVVSHNPGLTQSAIGAALGIKRANMAALVDGLAARDLVTKRRASSDRRAQALHLTSAGRSLLAELQRRELAHEGRLTATVGPEGRRALLGLLAAVTDACGPDSESSEPDEE